MAGYYACHAFILFCKKLLHSLQSFYHKFFSYFEILYLYGQQSTVKEKVYPIEKKKKKKKKMTTYLLKKKKKKKKKMTTYLPILKLMDRSTANKEYFKGGLVCTCMSSTSTFSQLYLHSLQACLSHFSSVAWFWWGIDGISFSWKSNANLGCYGNQKIP